MPFTSKVYLFFSNFISSMIMPTTEKSVGGTVIGHIGGMIWELFWSWFYQICKWLLAFMDFLQYFIQKLIGLDYWLTTSNNGNRTLQGATSEDMLFKFLYADSIQKVFRALIVVFVLLLIIFTIFQIIKSEWDYMTGDGSGGNSKAKIFKSAIKAIALVITFPVLLVMGIVSSNAILASIIKAVNIDMSSTFGGMLFSVSAQSANKYRHYVDANTYYPTTDEITFYTSNDSEPKNKIIMFGEGTADENKIYYLNYTDYLAAIKNGTKHTIKTVFDPIVPSDEEKFKGFCFRIIDEDGRYEYYFVKADRSADSHYVDDVYLYLTKVIEADVLNEDFTDFLGTTTTDVGFDLRKELKFSTECDGCYIDGKDLKTIGGSDNKLRNVCRNTWDYSKIYISPNKALSQTIDSHGNQSLSNYDLGNSGVGAILYNSESISGYFDGGQFGVVQSPAEYSVMADVIDFMCDNNLKFYIMDATSPLIDWNYHYTTKNSTNPTDYTVDNKWVSSKLTEAIGDSVNPYKITAAKVSNVATVLNDEKYLTFLASYSNNSCTAAESEQDIIYTAKFESNDALTGSELNGSKYIICLKNEDNYYPLVNGKEFVVNDERYEFKSNYYSSDYKGVVFAKGTFDTSSTDALFGNPTFMKNTTSIELDDKLVKTDEDGGYYYDFTTTGPDTDLKYIMNIYDYGTRRIGEYSDVTETKTVGDETKTLKYTLPTSNAYYATYNEGYLYSAGETNLTFNKTQKTLKTPSSHNFSCTYTLSPTGHKYVDESKNEYEQYATATRGYCYVLFKKGDTWYKPKENDVSMPVTSSSYSGGGLKLWYLNGTGSKVANDFVLKSYEIDKMVFGESANNALTTTYSIFDDKTYFGTFKKKFLSGVGGDTLNGINGWTKEIETNDGSTYYNINTVGKIAGTLSKNLSGEDVEISGCKVKTGSVEATMLEFYGATHNYDSITCYRDNIENFVGNSFLSVKIEINIKITKGIFDIKFGNIQQITKKAEPSTVFLYAGGNSEGIQFDYFFDQNIKLKTFYSAANINYALLVVASVLIIKVLFSALWGVIKRFYMITLYYLAMPVAASTMPLDDGSRFSTVREEIIKQVLSTYGVLIGLNVFFVLIVPIEDISKSIFTEETIANSGSYFLKKLPINAWMLNEFVYILFLLVAFTLINDLPTLVQGLVSKGESLDVSGAKTKGAVSSSLKSVKESAQKTISGQGLLDAKEQLKKDIPGFIPGLAIAKDVTQKFGKGVDTARNMFNKGRKGVSPDFDDSDTPPPTGGGGGGGGKGKGKKNASDGDEEVQSDAQNLENASESGSDPMNHVHGKTNASDNLTEDEQVRKVLDNVGAKEKQEILNDLSSDKDGPFAGKQISYRNGVFRVDGEEADAEQVKAIEGKLHEKLSNPKDENGKKYIDNGRVLVGDKKGLLESAADTSDAQVKVLKDLGGKAKDKAVEFGGDIKNWFGDRISDVGKWVGHKAGLVRGKIKDGITKIGNSRLVKSVKNSFTEEGWIGRSTKWVGTKAGLVRGKIKDGITKIGNSRLVRSVKNSFTEEGWIGRSTKWVAETGKKFGRGINVAAQVIHDFPGNVKKKYRKVKDSVLDKLESAKESVSNWGIVRFGKAAAKYAIATGMTLARPFAGRYKPVKKLPKNYGVLKSKKGEKGKTYAGAGLAASQNDTQDVQNPKAKKRVGLWSKVNSKKQSFVAQNSSVTVKIKNKIEKQAETKATIKEPTKAEIGAKSIINGIKKGEDSVDITSKLNEAQRNAFIASVGLTGEEGGSSNNHITVEKNIFGRARVFVSGKDEKGNFVQREVKDKKVKSQFFENEASKLTPEQSSAIADELTAKQRQAEERKEQKAARAAEKMLKKAESEQKIQFAQRSGVIEGGASVVVANAPGPVQAQGVGTAYASANPTNVAGTHTVIQTLNLIANDSSEVSSLMASAMETHILMDDADSIKAAKRVVNAESFNDSTFVRNQDEAVANIIRNSSGTAVGRIVAGDVFRATAESEGTDVAGLLLNGYQNRKGQDSQALISAAQKIELYKSAMTNEQLEMLTNSDSFKSGDLAKQLELIEGDALTNKGMGLKLGVGLDAQNGFAFNVNGSILDKTDAQKALVADTVRAVLGNGMISNQTIAESVNNTGYYNEVRQQYALNYASTVNYDREHNGDTDGDLAHQRVFDIASENKDIIAEAVYRYMQSHAEFLDRFNTQYNPNKNLSLDTILETIKGNLDNRDSVLSQISPDAYKEEFSQVLQSHVSNNSFRVEAFDLLQRSEQENYAEHLNANLTAEQGQKYGLTEVEQTVRNDLSGQLFGDQELINAFVNSNIEDKGAIVDLMVIDKFNGDWKTLEAEMQNDAAIQEKVKKIKSLNLGITDNELVTAYLKAKITGKTSADDFEKIARKTVSVDNEVVEKLAQEDGAKFDKFNDELVYGSKVDGGANVNDYISNFMAQGKEQREYVESLLRKLEPDQNKSIDDILTSKIDVENLMELNAEARESARSESSFSVISTLKQYATDDQREALRKESLQNGVSALSGQEQIKVLAQIAQKDEGAIQVLSDNNIDVGSIDAVSAYLNSAKGQNLKERLARESSLSLLDVKAMNRGFNEDAIYSAIHHEAYATKSSSAIASVEGELISNENVKAHLAKGTDTQTGNDAEAIVAAASRLSLLTKEEQQVILDNSIYSQAMTENAEKYNAISQKAMLDYYLSMEKTKNQENRFDAIYKPFAQIAQKNNRQLTPAEISQILEMLNKDGSFKNDRRLERGKQEAARKAVVEEVRTNDSDIEKKAQGNYVAEKTIAIRNALSGGGLERQRDVASIIWNNDIARANAEKLFKNGNLKNVGELDRNDFLFRHYSEIVSGNAQLQKEVEEAISKHSVEFTKTGSAQKAIERMSQAEFNGIVKSMKTDGEGILAREREKVAEKYGEYLELSAVPEESKMSKEERKRYQSIVSELNHAYMQNSDSEIFADMYRNTTLVNEQESLRQILSKGNSNASQSDIHRARVEALRNNKEFVNTVNLDVLQKNYKDLFEQIKAYYKEKNNIDFDSLKLSEKGDLIDKIFKNQEFFKDKKYNASAIMGVFNRELDKRAKTATNEQVKMGLTNEQILSYLRTDHGSKTRDKMIKVGAFNPHTAFPRNRYRIGRLDYIMKDPNLRKTLVNSIMSRLYESKMLGNMIKKELTTQTSPMFNSKVAKMDLTQLNSYINNNFNSLANRLGEQMLTERKPNGQYALKPSIDENSINKAIERVIKTNPMFASALKGAFSGALLSKFGVRGNNNPNIDELLKQLNERNKTNQTFAETVRKITKPTIKQQIDEAISGSRLAYLVDEKIENRNLPLDTQMRVLKTRNKLLRKDIEAMQKRVNELQKSRNKKAS